MHEKQTPEASSRKAASETSDILTAEAAEGGFEKYQKLMVDWTTEIRLMHFNLEEKRDDLPEPLRSFFFKIFLGFVEISDAFEALKLSELLISLAPPRSKKIKKDEYLKYHINAYLQEVYILKERLKSYATKLQRSYPEAAWKDQFIKVTNPLERVINESLENVISVRGSHVHESRYSDEDLNSLSALTIISESNEFRIYDLNIQYVLSQEKWKRQIRENNQETKKLLDIYFSTLHQAIAPEGDILVP